MNDKYELRLFDEPLLSFQFKTFHSGGNYVSDLLVNDCHSQLLPLNLYPSEDGLWAWFSRRIIPHGRIFVEKIMQSLGLSGSDVKGIIDVCKGLSLNDSYWVVPENFDGKFSDYNLYENRFSEVLGQVAFSGQGLKETVLSISPELTTNGMLPKAWRFIENDGIYLYKGGISGAVNEDNEPYCEFYASQIAQAMDLEAVVYDLDKWHGITASTCKLFTNIETSYVPIGNIVTQGGLDGVFDFYKSCGVRFSDSFCDMMIFDAVIYNIDRHFGNYGILRDNRSGEIIAPAPVFDNGLSLFNFAMEGDFDDLKSYSRSCLPACTSVGFEELVISLITPRQISKLRKLANFKFERHDKYNWPEWRIKAVEDHLQVRLSQLLSYAAPKK